MKLGGSTVGLLSAAGVEDSDVSARRGPCAVDRWRLTSSISAIMRSLSPCFDHPDLAQHRAGKLGEEALDTVSHDAGRVASQGRVLLSMRGMIVPLRSPAVPSRSRPFHGHSRERALSPSDAALAFRTQTNTARRVCSTRLMA
jgi:hypothetical protein